jgi:hypothetical protein
MATRVLNSGLSISIPSSNIEAAAEPRQPSTKYFELHPLEDVEPTIPTGDVALRHRRMPALVRSIWAMHRRSVISSHLPHQSGTAVKGLSEMYEDLMVFAM